MSRADRLSSKVEQGQGSRRAERWQFVSDVDGQPQAERTSSVGIVVFSLALFAVVYGLTMVVGWALVGRIEPVLFFVALVVAMLVAMGVHVAQQWERVVVLRLGRFNRVSGPGLFWTIPFIEQNTVRIDCRVRATTFDAKETLTADLVPLDVNAVLLWMVYDAKAACTECCDFSRTVELAAQAALRDAIGRLSAAEVAIRREQLDADIKETLENEAAQWGLSVLSVKVRDILLPANLYDVMSLEAQAEQRRKARLILMEAEQDIAEMVEGVGDAYGSDDAALKVRAMHLLYESVRETGGTVVIPSSLGDCFGDGLPEEAKRLLRDMSH